MHTRNNVFTQIKLLFSFLLEKIKQNKNLAQHRKTTTDYKVWNFCFRYCNDISKFKYGTDILVEIIYKNITVI